MKLLLIFCTMLCLLLPLAGPGRAAVWQYRASTADGTGHSVLWIPPHCARVRGVLIGRQVILESVVFEDPVIRRAAADEGLAILLNDGSLGYFAYGSAPDAQDKHLQEFLTAFAAQSGHPEIADAPLLSLGHSGGAIFAFNVGYWNPSRTIGIIGLHTVPLLRPDFDPKATISGVPALDITGQYERWDDPAVPLDQHTRWVRGIALSMRSNPGDGLITELVEPGAGHFSWTPQLADYVALFIRKAAEARIPDDPPAGTPVVCKRVPRESGWLIDCTLTDPPRYPAAPYAQYKGDPTLAFWNLDRELALATEKYNTQDHGKKRQMVGFTQDGRPLKPGWLVPIPFEPVGDGMTVKVAADYLHAVPEGVGDAGEPLFPSGTPIKYRLIGGWRGGGEQTGPDTFRIRLNHFGLDRAGSLMIMAYSEGDKTHGYTELAGDVTFPVKNTAGAPQTITFPPLPDQPAGATVVPLAATSDAGLPVEYFVQYGPAEVHGSVLTLADVPAHASLPLKVSVVAYQLGRAGAAPIQSAAPVEQTFLVGK